MLRELLMEDSKLSMLRLLSLLCVLAAIGLAYFGMLQKMDINNISMLCGVFLGAAFGGKITQKFIEK